LDDVACLGFTHKVHLQALELMALMELQRMGIE
jgi:hypothetical protein